MNLKDKTLNSQLLMQLHDKGRISTRILCEELDLNYDKEIQRIRDHRFNTDNSKGASK